MKWLWERTGLNILEQQRLPLSVMCGYRGRFAAGYKAMATNEHGYDGVKARGW